MVPCVFCNGTTKSCPTHFAPFTLLRVLFLFSYSCLCTVLLVLQDILVSRNHHHAEGFMNDDGLSTFPILVLSLSLARCCACLCFLPFAVTLLFLVFLVLMIMSNHLLPDKREKETARRGKEGSQSMIHIIIRSERGMRERTMRYCMLIQGCCRKAKVEQC